MLMSLTCKCTTGFGQLTDVFIIQQLKVHDLQLLSAHTLGMQLYLKTDQNNKNRRIIFKESYCGQSRAS